MARTPKSRTLNVQLYKRIWKEIDESDTSGKKEDFLLLIGAVTTTFEFCEFLLATILKQLSGESGIAQISFNIINSRSMRAQFLEEFLELRRPKRGSKRYDAICAAFTSYNSLGSKRDEVAHGMLRQDTSKGITRLLIVASAHVDRKNVAGLPKYHYDVPKLESLVKDLQSLYDSLLQILDEIGEQNRRRRLRRAQSEKQTSQKRAPQNQRRAKPQRLPKPSQS